MPLAVAAVLAILLLLPAQVQADEPDLLEAQRLEAEAAQALATRDLGAAEAAAARALDLRERHVGRAHPSLAPALEVLAEVEAQRAGGVVTWEALLPSLRLRERALRLLEQAHGPDDARLAPVCLAIAHTYAPLGDQWRAATHYERAFRLAEPGRAAQDPVLLDSLQRAIDGWASIRARICYQEERWRCGELAARHLERARREGAPADEHRLDLLLCVASGLRGSVAALEQVDVVLGDALALATARRADDKDRWERVHLALTEQALEKGDVTGFETYLPQANLGRVTSAGQLIGTPIFGHPYIQEFPQLHAVLATFRRATASGGQVYEALARARAELVGNTQVQSLAVAEQVAAEHLAAEQAAHGPRSRQAAVAHMLCAQVAAVRGRWDAAVAHREQQIAILVATVGARTDPTLEALTALAQTLQQAGRANDAYAAHERACAGKLPSAPRRGSDLERWTSYAVVAADVDRPERSHALLDALVGALRSDVGLQAALQAEMGSPDARATVVSALTTLAALCARMGRWSDLDWIRRDLQQMLGTGLSLRPDLHRRGDLVAVLREVRTDAEKREQQMAEQAARSTDTTWVPQKTFDFAVMRLGLAEALLRAGAYEEGLAEFLTALERLDGIALLPSGSAVPHYLATMAVYARVAESQRQRGDPQGARVFSARALSLYRHLPDLWDPSAGRLGVTRFDAFAAFLPAPLEVDLVATAIPVTHARILHVLGETESALRLLGEVVADTERRFSSTHPSVADALTALARIELETGRTALARQHAERAREILEAAYGPEHPGLASVWISLAEARVIEGRPSEALAEYARALGILSKTVYESHPDVALAHGGMAIALARSRRAEEAQAAMRRSMRIVRSRLDAFLVGSTGNERLELAASTHWALAAWLEVAEAAGIDGYAEVLSLRGLAQRALAAEERLYRQSTGANRHAFEALRTARRRLARVALEAPRPGWQRMAWLRDVAEASAAVDEKSRRLAKAMAAFRSAKQEPELDPKSLQAALPAEAALIDVVCAGGRYWAFVVRRGADPRRVDLGESEALDAALDAYRAALRSAEEPGDTALGQASSALRALLWIPLASALGPDVKRVLLVPDGGLCAVPLGALPLGEDETSSGDSLMVTLLTAPHDLRTAKPAPPSGKGLLVVGSVDYDAAIQATDGPVVTGQETLHQRVGGWRTFQRLPATRLEADAVLAKFAAASGGRPGTLLTEESASEGALRAAVEGCRIVHLATHGYVREGLNASLRMPPGDIWLLRPGLERHVQCFDPLLLSGLALSGANKRLREGEDDGILTALESLALPLEGVDLVVLSACDSARGIVASGEGTFGLVRGMTLAGARNVVGSLWPVDDVATTALMTRFYEHYLGARLAPTEALKRAAEELSRGDAGAALRAPRHHAAFVVYGTGRSP